MYCTLERIVSFNGLLIHEGCWIYEALVGFKPTRTLVRELQNVIDFQLSKAKFLVLEVYFI